MAMFTALLKSGISDEGFLWMRDEIGKEVKVDRVYEVG